MIFGAMAAALSLVACILQICWEIPLGKKAHIDKRIRRMLAIIVMLCFVLVFDVIALTDYIMVGSADLVDYIIIPLNVLWLLIKMLNLHILIEIKIKSNE